MPRFTFAFDPRFRPILLAAGATPRTSHVDVEDGWFRARFGLFRCETPVSNIAGWELSGPYRWFKAIGPRGSLADGGATFGTTAAGGVCVRFHEPVTALAGSLLPHRGLTVTVADREGLVAAIEAEQAGSGQP